LKLFFPHKVENSSEKAPGKKKVLAGKAVSGGGKQSVLGGRAGKKQKRGGHPEKSTFGGE